MWQSLHHTKLAGMTQYQPVTDRHKPIANTHASIESCSKNQTVEKKTYMATGLLFIWMSLLTFTCSHLNMKAYKLILFSDCLYAKTVHTQLHLLKQLFPSMIEVISLRSCCDQSRVASSPLSCPTGLVKESICGKISMLKNCTMCRQQQFREFPCHCQAGQWQNNNDEWQKK